MNRFHCLLTAGALTLPLAVLANDPPASPETVGAAPVAGPTVQRVEQRDLAAAFTARDLIGKNVVNYDGDRLGTINDVGLSDAWGERFGVSTADEEAGAAEAVEQRQGEQLVYISTGGVLGLGGRLGMGADWVGVPADQLLYDRNQDRFILNMTRGRFASIAEGHPRVGPTAGAATVGAGSGSNPAIGGTIAAAGSNRPAAGAAPAAGRDQDRTAHVQRIEQALRADADLRNRTRIQVAHTGAAIQLTGEVDDPALIRRAGDVARKETDLEVRNLLEVSDTVAE